jgi:hypothetical protein
MEWLPIESHMFTAAAYAAEGRILYLRFRSGLTYRYFEFPPEQFQSFLDAESRGRYFLSHIRDQFPYERLARLELVGTA